MAVSGDLAGVMLWAVWLPEHWAEVGNMPGRTPCAAKD